MKKRPIFILVVLLALIVSACGTPTTTPTPTAAVEPVEPTATLAPSATSAPEATASPAPTEPQGSGNPTWDRILAAGKIVIGTSADYKPYEYYDENLNMTGFDIAIARDLAARLGLQVEIKDYAFEGLSTALMVGDIDAAIAAISVTANRQTLADFSDVYFWDQDAVLARADSGYAEITTPVQMVAFRVGVQRGSTYEAYLMKTLVEPGYMAKENLLQYEKPEHAVRDLKENRVDLVFLGALAAQDYVAQGGVEIVGQSLNYQLYAIAMPLGSTVLRDNLNTNLTAMRNDGTMAAYATDYLHINLDELPPAETVPPPGEPAEPGACYDSMQYVADITVPDWTYVEPGQDFDKTWRILNNGTCAWDSTYRLVFVQGSSMDGGPATIQGTVNPGAMYDVTIDQTAPTTPGYYQGWWQMVNGQNVAFGPRIWVAITVPGAPEPTATIAPTVPTATLAPDQPTPTLAPATATLPPPTPTTPPPTPTEPPSVALPIATPQPLPVISAFTAEPASIAVGGTIVVSWSFTGDSLALARVVRTGPDGTVIPLNGNQDVTSTGSLNDLAQSPGAYIYTLVVSNEFGGTSTMSATVTVTAP